MKHLILFAFLFSFPAAAQTPEEIPQAQSHQVTSVESCLVQLPPAAAAEVRHSLKPYEDCQRRLRQVVEKKEADKEEESEKAKAPAEAETPRNYVRVQTPAEPKNKPEKP